MNITSTSGHYHDPNRRDADCKRCKGHGRLSRPLTEQEADRRLAILIRETDGRPNEFRSDTSDFGLESCPDCRGTGHAAGTCDCP